MTPLVTINLLIVQSVQDTKQGTTQYAEVESFYCKVLTKTGEYNRQTGWMVTQFMPGKTI
jgi:hypothetical protein